MIAVIDYKAGNLTSVVKALHAAGVDPVVTDDPAIVRSAERLILPGVGHFSATQVLAERGLKAALAERIDSGVPFLGICVGLQWLFSGSSEAPSCTGLGVFPEGCEKFAADKKVPHVGWNTLAIRSGSRLLAGIADGSYVYFTHSWRAPVIHDTVAVTEYGVSLNASGGEGPAEAFSAAVERENVMGVQFHPEKSGEAGLRVLRNFLELPLC